MGGDGENWGWKIRGWIGGQLGIVKYLNGLVKGWGGVRDRMGGLGGGDSWL